MRRAKDLAAVTLVTILGLTACLAACSQGTSAPTAATQTPSDDRAVSEEIPGGDGPATVSADGMSEVVITAQRERTPSIVLSQRESRSVAK